MREFQNKDNNSKIKEEFRRSLNFKPTHLALVSLFSKHRGIPLVLGGLPDIIYRQQITNQLTIYQLREILEQCTERNVLTPDLTPNTPLNMAQNLFPKHFRFN